MTHQHVTVDISSETQKTDGVVGMHSQELRVDEPKLTQESERFELYALVCIIGAVLLVFAL